MAPHAPKTNSTNITGRSMYISDKDGRGTLRPKITGPHMVALEPQPWASSPCSSFLQSFSKRCILDIFCAWNDYERVQCCRLRHGTS